ncbi:MAG: hypothetical protein AABZ47_07110 [Planctomycetota bacterium]
MRLAEQIQAIERRGIGSVGVSTTGRADRLIPTAWSGIDAALQGGLVCGAMHEWFGIASPTAFDMRAGEKRTYKDRFWTPPVGPLVHLAWRVIESASYPQQIVWIGDRCFPYPRVLVRGDGDDRRLLERSIFVSTHNPNDRLWAIDLSLRSPVVGLAIADGSRFDMAATRRIQLLAKVHGTLALIVRPPWEGIELSAAETRWLLRWEAPLPNVTGKEPVGYGPRWSMELLRCKGLQPDDARRRWVLEWNRAACLVNLSSSLADQDRRTTAIASSNDRPIYGQRSA